MIKKTEKVIISKWIAIGVILIVGVLLSKYISGGATSSITTDDDDILVFDGYTGKNSVSEYQFFLIEKYSEIAFFRGELLSGLNKSDLIYRMTAFDENGTSVTQVEYQIENSLYSDKLQKEIESMKSSLDSENQYTRMFVNVNFDGSYTTRSQDATYIGDYYNDRISSIRTWSDYWTSYQWTYFEHSYYTGDYYTLLNGADDSSLVSEGMNDIISSFYFVGNY